MSPCDHTWTSEEKTSHECGQYIYTRKLLVLLLYFLCLGKYQRRPPVFHKLILIYRYNIYLLILACLTTRTYCSVVGSAYADRLYVFCKLKFKLILIQFNSS